MSGSKTDYHEANVLNWLRGTAFPAAPSTCYAALFTGDPTEAGGGTECSGSGYARQAIAWTTISGSPSQISNSAKITFPAATGSGYTITGVAVFDAVSGGNMLYFDASPAGTIAVGDNFKIDIGGLVISED